ncbi:MAG: D-glycero-beta-D-manno-heptose 1-phosphate adenylyltransferase [Nitrospinae bacterium]|nr:D-glycero-beta-D-manno-heptose 1-phosphate adenylyltransferase [Nitrospinota bacterium]
MRRRLLEIFGELKPRPTLVVGDVILDRYLEGHVERISPEAPAPVFESRGEREVAGGAANVAANVAALGARAALVGVTGRDADAARLRALLAGQGISPRGLVADPSRVTTRKTRLMAQRQQMLRVDRETRESAPRAAGERMLAAIRLELPRVGGVIVSDYGKGALPEWLLKELFALCRKAGKETIVDPKGADYARYRGAAMITPNRAEAAAAARMEIVREEDYEKAAARLFEITGARRLVITRGPEGMSVFDGPGKPGLRLAAEALEVFDVSGAGDTVIAALGVALFSGVELEAAARIANVAAAIEVGHLGAWAVSRQEIMDRLDGGAPRKIMDRAQVAAFAKAARARGEAVVFTNGCFDLLHAGHIKLLRQARAFGDRLIVGLNTDRSVRRLKGPGRPALSEDDRAEILAALDCVDAVSLFDEPTPLKLIRAALPDVLVKGGDYTVDAVVGREVVEKRGGRVELVRLVEGRSTTGLINRILDAHGHKPRVKGKR